MVICTCPHGMDYPGCCWRKAKDEWWEVEYKFKELEYMDWTRTPELVQRVLSEAMESPDFVSVTIKRRERK